MSLRHVAFYIAGELLLHWLLAKNQESFLFALYATRDSGNKYFMAGTIDFIIPACILGSAFGWKSWPEVKINHVLVAAFCGTTIIALMPFAYGRMFGTGAFTEIWGIRFFRFDRPFCSSCSLRSFPHSFSFKACTWCVEI